MQLEPPDSILPDSPVIDLLREGLSCELDLLQWRAGFSSELVARAEPLSLPGSGRSAIGLLFLWSSLAFLEARPLLREGVVPSDYQAEDGWSSIDFLTHLRWEEARLVLNLSVLRGRQISTHLWLRRDGLFTVQTAGRGDSALGWFESFRR